MRAQKVGVYGLIPAATVIILISVAVGLNKWQYKNGRVSKYVEYGVHAGLWKFCNETVLAYYTQSGMNTLYIEETLTSVCFDTADIYTPEMTKFLTIVKYALFAAMASMFLAILGTLVKRFVLKEWQHEKQQKALGYINALLAFLTGVLTLVAFSMFNAELRFEGYSLHAGFYLTVVAWLLSWVTASFFIASGICIGAKMYPDLK